MHPAGLGSALRETRLARGWSQSEAARELAALGSRRALTTASPASLKTQLSRWENGHVAPEPVYRMLLAELFERPELAELAEPPDAAAQHERADDRLRAAVAAARGADEEVLRLLAVQLRSSRAIDERLGVTGAGAAVGAQIEQLTDLARHTTSVVRRRQVATLAAEAGVLGGWQAYDQERPDLAFARHDAARGHALEAESPALLGEALAGQSAALLGVGLPDDALAVLDAAPATGPGAAWPAAARGVVHAGLGEVGRASRAFAEAVAAASARGASTDAPPQASGGPARPIVDVVRPAVETIIDVGALHRLRDLSLAAHGDDELRGLRRAVADPTPRAVRERAGLHAGLALALTERGEAHDEAADHARTARELATRIGSDRIRRLLDGCPR